MQTQNNGTPAFVADCGHEIPALPAGHVGGTNYATTADKRRICYQCAADATRAHMIAEGCQILYLVDHSTRPPEITDWSGKLRFPTFNLTRSRGRGFYGSSYRIVTGRFQGPDGKLWAFRCAGNYGEIATCLRLKDAR